MDKPAITYTPHPDAHPEGELSALAAVYRLMLDSKKATRPGGPDDARKDEDAGTYPQCT